MQKKTSMLKHLFDQSSWDQDQTPRWEVLCGSGYVQHHVGMRELPKAARRVSCHGWTRRWVKTRDEWVNEYFSWECLLYSKACVFLVSSLVYKYIYSRGRWLQFGIVIFEEMFRYLKVPQAPSLAERKAHNWKEIRDDLAVSSLRISILLRLARKQCGCWEHIKDREAWLAALKDINVMWTSPGKKFVDPKSKALIYHILPSRLILSNCRS